MTYNTTLEGTTGVTAQAMLEQGDLETVADLRSRLRTDDGVGHFTLPMDGRVHFEMAEAWFVNLDGKRDNEPVDVWVRIDERRQPTQHEWESADQMPVMEEARRLRLSKAAVLELTSNVGLPKTYVVKTPARLIMPQLDYWYASPDRQTKLLVVDGEGGQVAIGAAKASLQPFSNVRLLDRAVRAIQERYGIGEDGVFVDRKKSRHSMKETVIYLVIPESTRSMRPGDDWSGGVVLKNSLLGESATTARSFLFRWWCKNGATTQKHQSTTYSRRGATGQQEEVYDWVGRAVEESLSQIEGEFDRVQAMTTEPIEGEVRVAVDNIIRSYKLPATVAEAIRNQMMETSDVTMYGLMNAVTAAANSAGIPTNMSERLMDIGGDFVGGAHRCEACHSVQVEPATGATTPPAPHQH